jgi:molybdopterin synthase catalytic subunit
MTTTARVHVAISSNALDVTAHERAVTHPAAGASVVFCGVVRDVDANRTVVELEYEAYPTAGEVLAEIADRFAADPEVHAIAVSHRVGRLAVGDIAIVAAVSTMHRGKAFEVCAQLVDEVKHRLPVWKRQVFADGSDEWVNCP